MMGLPSKEELDRRIKERNATTSTGKSLPSKEELDRKARLQKAPGTLRSKVNALSELYDEYAKQYKGRYVGGQGYFGSYRWDSAYWLEKTNFFSNQWNQQSRDIQTFIQNNADALDQDEIGKIKSWLLEGDKIAGRMRDTAKRENDYFSQWDTEDDFNTAIAAQKADEALKSFDLVAGEKEVKDLEAELEAFYNATTAYYRDMDDGIEDAEITAKYNAYVQKYGSREDLLKLINEKSVYLNNARRAQEKAKLAAVADPESELYDPEFSQYSGYVSQGDPVHDYINGKRKDWSISVGGISQEGLYSNKGYDRLTDKEIATYNYYYAKGGKEAAEKYLDSIQESLNAQVGQEIAAAVPDVPILQDAFALAVGLDQFGSGMKGIYRGITGEDSYVPASAMQMAGAMTREDREDKVWYNFKTGQWEDKVLGLSVGKTKHDLLTSVGNMVPSMLTSTAIGIVNPTLGAVAGNALMGVSAAGNAYQEKVNQGYDADQAMTYGLMIGTSEATLQQMLGGIGKLGVQTLSKAALKNLNMVDDVFAQFAKSAGGQLLMNASSEALEEGLQSVIEPYIWQAVSGEEATVDWGEALYSALLGFATGGLFEGVETSANTIHTNRQYTAIGKPVMKAQGGVDALVNLANEMHGVSNEIQRQAQKVERKATAKNVGKLLSDIQQSVNAQNTNDLSARLTERGVDAWQAKQIAEAVITARTNARSLTREQISLLESTQGDSRVAATVQEVLDTEGSAAYQRTAQLRNAISKIKSPSVQAESDSAAQTQSAGVEQTLEGLAQDMVADDTVEVPDGDIPSAEGKILRGKETVEIADIDTAGKGKLIVKLTDGSTANVSELSFPNEGEQELWRVVAAYADNAEAARQLLKEYRAGDLTAWQYARGIEEGFLYGKLNMGEAEMSRRGSYVNMLNPTQRNTAYRLGQYAGEKQVRQRQEKVDAAKKLGNDKKGKLHFEGDRDSLSDRQRASLDACEVIAKTLGIQVHVFESGKDAWGKRIGENGWYDPKDGSIHIDLHAGENSEGVMVFTLAHELTHFIKDWSPAKYRALASFLAEQYGKKGLSVRDMVLKQQEKAESNGRKLTFEQAHEEWVADSMETMLTDGAILEKLSMLQAKDKTLAQKIRQFLDQFLQRLKSAYKDVSPQTVEGRIVSEMVDAAQELSNLFADALTDAGNNFRSAEKNTTGEGGVRYQARPSKKNPELLDPRTVTKADVHELLENVKNGKYGKNTYIPVRINTPGIIQERLFAEDNPMAMPVKKVLQAFKPDQGPIIGKNVRGHSLSIDDVLEIIERLDSPDYLFSQEDGRGVAVIKWRGNTAVVVELGNNINTPYMNGFEGGRYNISITAFDIDGGDVGLYMMQQEKGWNKVFDKEKEGDPAKKFQATRPFAIEQDSLNKSVSHPQYDVKENDSTEKRSSARTGTGVSDRAMLVDLFEQMVTDSNEYKALQNYKKHMDEMLKIEEHLERVTAEIRRLSFAEGPKDTEMLKNLKLQQKQAVNRLNNYDSILLRLEKSGVLSAMIERNRKKITQESFDRAREYYREKNERRESEIRQYYRESRRQAVERHDMAEVRQRIRKDVARLDSLLNKGTKKKNVKLELKEFAGAALRTAKGTFLNNYNEYEMIRSGVNASMSREHKAVFVRCQELLTELDKVRDEMNAEPAADNFHDKWDPEAALRLEDREEALKKELAKNMSVLREAGIFRLENELMEDANSEQLMDELLSAYSALKDSELAHVRGVFSDAVYGQMEEVKKFLGGKAIKDMTAIELRELQKMYRMVLHTITTSNDLFAQKRKADVRKLGEEVITQLQTEGKEMTPEILDRLAKMGWANLKPETALELIGSDTLTEMMQGLYRGEDTYALDIDHARQYAEEQAKKYGRKKWDMNKAISFAGTKITLGQAMSLYAYTKRKQAQGHLEGDGFTNSSNVRIKEKKGKLPVELLYIMNATKTHKVSKDMYEKVAQLLTPEQRKYADAMQEYLSQVMGAKGNEVALKLYGIKLFEETMYFPLKTASQFHEEALGAKTGDVKLKNSGFTKSVQDKARNPIVLDDFESVWAAHVDKMSLYHGFVLPMEDFDRVYNYHRAIEQDVTDAAGEVYKTELVDTNETVKVDIENKAGKAANDYIEQFMQQLNGGVRGDATEKLFGGMVRSFKKSAVMASLSVAVQQPTAFIRAMAYLDMKDIVDWRNWLGKKGKPDGKLVAEMYKYAPVALMKHIGGFDPGLGRSTQNYIFGGKGVMNAVDTVAGWLPEHMDEWTWTYIWLCTKRQIHRQHPELRVGSKEFCKKAGERFSQIIRSTQVYDSVLTKSQIMRSKNIFLQMATSFMNEPTTSLDMYIRSTIQVKRGKISKKQAARTYGAVIGSQILVAAVSAFVYAARDDGEDETYWEKYMSAFIGKSVEGIIPLYSIPFVRDIISIAEGYSVERSDMALVADLSQAWQKLKSDNVGPWEKTEAFAGSVLNFFGIPLKNASRDVRGIYNTVKRWIEGSVTGTSAGMKYAVLEGLPFGNKPSKADQLKNAVAENDAAHILRIMGTYDEEDKALSAVRSAVREVYLQGELSEEDAMELLQVYAGNDSEEAQDLLIKWSNKQSFEQEHPKTGFTEAQISDWYEYAEPAGISFKIYAQYAAEVSEYESDRDEDGEVIPGSKRDKILTVIDGLPLSREQKDALYYANDYAESRLWETPWH